MVLPYSILKRLHSAIHNNCWWIVFAIINKLSAVSTTFSFHIEVEISHYCNGNTPLKVFASLLAKHWSWKATICSTDAPAQLSHAPYINIQSNFGAIKPEWVYTVCRLLFEFVVSSSLYCMHGGQDWVCSFVFTILHARRAGLSLC